MKAITINSYQAAIAFDQDIQMFRGEFAYLNGGVDFYAKDVDDLKHDGESSLKIFLEACAENGTSHALAVPKLVSGSGYHEGNPSSGLICIR